ncbi:MAG: TolC family protein [Isosphaeraceae bacterium]|nr:TolC family protein [Isosphaeraceae bacterium]
MSRHIILCSIALAIAAGYGSRSARGQGVISVADEIIVISQGQRAKEQRRDSTHLGPIHGPGERYFAATPGSDEPRLGERFPEQRPLDVTAAASAALRGQAGIGAERPGLLPPAVPEAEARPQPPLYGPQSLAALKDEGPPDGLTLEAAIARLVHANPDLAVKFREIPKADADILTAGLWGNPLIFAAFDQIPYGSYSPQRPGSNTYNITIVQPIDINGKFRARTRLAQSAKQVLMAQYQDAVRQEVEILHVAFVDVLAARIAVRLLQESLANSEGLLRTAQDRVRRGASPESELDEMLIRRETIAVALEEAASRLRQEKRDLAVLLGVPVAQADLIEPLGTIFDRAPTPPPVEDLIRLALCNRPDLTAYRLGVRSATANVEVQRRERFPDVFALYSPYSFNANNDDYNARSATSWGAGIFASVPILNRNQGNIRRAHENIIQAQREVVGLEQLVVAEVQKAVLEYNSSRAAIERFDRLILPRAKHLRADKQRLYTEGQEGLDTYLNAESSYNEVVRQYRDTLIRHRRAMLALNTAVGVRVLP